MDLGEMRFENTSEGHNKFYRIKFQFIGERWLVTKKYGRIGNRQFTRKSDIFLDRNDAIEFITQTIKTRVAHGYHLVGQPTLKLSETS